jgi:FtsX-like permease family
VAALGIGFRAQLRARWRAWLALVLLAGATGGVLLALAAASRRTSTAFERFLAATNAADAYVGWGFAFGGGHLDVDRIARLPQVAASQRRLLLAVIARSRSGASLYPVGPGSLEVQVPTDGHPNTIDRPKLVQGRLPDPARPNEVLADTSSSRYLGLRLGEATAVRFISRRTLYGNGVPLTVDPRKARGGPLVRVRIVGIEAYWHSDVDSGYLFLTPAFYRAHGGNRLGAYAGQLQVRLKHGRADLPAFRAAVGRIAGNTGYVIFDPGASRPEAQRSIDFQGRALLLLAAFGTAAALMLVGQALYRQALLDAATHRTLRALGMTHGQLLALGALRAAVIAVPAALLSVLLAFLLSPLAPVGRARQLEPDPGFDFSAAAIVPGAAAGLVAILLVGVIGSARAIAADRVAARRAPARRRGAAARAAWPPPVAAGVRMAIQAGSRPTTVPVRATLAAAMLAVGVGAAALTFAASLKHLLDTPRLYGQSWDFEIGGGGPAIDAATVRRVSSDPAFSDVAVGAVEPVEIGGQPLAGRAMDDVKGSSAPTVLEGRAPRRPGEALLGTKTLAALHLRIGDRVGVRSGRRAIPLRIVGRGVLPSTKFSKLSEGAAFSFRDLKRIQPSAAADALEARIAPGADRGAALRKLTMIFDAHSIAVRPTEVGDYGGVKALPLLIVAVFAGAAAAALAHALVTCVRRRRRELAILKTLGFTRPQVVAAVAAQATTVAAVGLLVGLPLGLGIGRFGWSVFAEGVGVVPEPVTPLGLSALVIPATILLSNLIAVLPARAAARTEPALVLRAE